MKINTLERTHGLRKCANFIKMQWNCIQCNLNITLKKVLKKKGSEAYWINWLIWEMLKYLRMLEVLLHLYTCSDFHNYHENYSSSVDHRHQLQALETTSSVSMRWWLCYRCLHTHTQMQLEPDNFHNMLITFSTLSRSRKPSVQLSRSACVPSPWRTLQKPASLRNLSISRPLNHYFTSNCPTAFFWI